MNDEQALEHGAFVDLSARTKLRITGADRLRFLNGQISNDLRKASEETGIYACVLNAKGKINADIFVCVEGASFLVDSDAELREQLLARFDRYIIADDVQIADVTEEFALFHVFGADGTALQAESRAVGANRFASDGLDFWVPRARHALALQTLSATLPLCDDDCAEILRVERGVPRWGCELSEEIIPTEANLEDSAIDYAKGCYIGQEVISRIKMSGQTNKRLCGLVGLTEAPLRAGMRLLETDDGKEVGTITSATTSVRLGKHIALGFVKRGSNETGRPLVARTAEPAASSESIPLEIVPLPFA